MTVLATRQGISFLLDQPAGPIHDGKATGTGQNPPRPPSDLPQRKDSLGFPKTVNLTPLAMSKDVQLEPYQPLTGKVHFFTGQDQRHWRTGVTPYEGVVFRNAYPGIDLKFYGKDGQVEYDVIVRPGADLRKVKFRYTGVRHIRLNNQGELLVTLPQGGTLVQRKPVIYQEISGDLVMRSGKYRIITHSGQPMYAFEIQSYDKSYPLIIDPVLDYSTYWGGGQAETLLGQTIAIDGQGNVYVTGATGSSDLVSTSSAYQKTLAGGYDVFVAKFGPKGSLIYATYLGGLGTEFGQSLAVDADGQVYITGYTTSDNFPVVNPLPGGEALKNGRGSFDAFLAMLSADGSTLLFSSFLGGTGRDYAFGLALDRNKDVYLVGATTSVDFPTTAGSYQPIKPGPEGDMDAFVAKISIPASSIIYATYLGGGLWDLGYGIAVDGEGNAHVIGTTFSNDVVSAPLRPFAGASDAFVARIEADGSSLGYSTYLGGTDQDEGSAIIVDADGNAYVTGATKSDDFITMNPLQTRKGGAQDAFVARISPPVAGSPPVPARISFSSFLGGSQDDYGYSVAVDPSGNIYVAGSSSSPDFPTKQRMRAYGGGIDAFITKINPAGDSLIYSTLLGGSGDDLAFALCLDKGGLVYLFGTTVSTNFPVVSPFQRNLNGYMEDVFVARIRERDPNITAVLSLLLDN